MILLLGPMELKALASSLAGYGSFGAGLYRHA